jgi:hypothetical protein
VVEVPPGVDYRRRLTQTFLLEDRDGNGAKVDGYIQLDGEGGGTFHVNDAKDLPHIKWKVPIKIYGNVVEVTRGETVRNEVLGSGDARMPHQTFKLRNKPLTYLPGPGADGALYRSTLEVYVNGVK